MSSAASHRLPTASPTLAICGSAGQKLISMLIAKINVFWSGCLFLFFSLSPERIWILPPKLNCTVNYPVIAFSGRDVRVRRLRPAPDCWLRHFWRLVRPQTLQDLTPPVNINLLPPLPDHPPLPAPFSFSPFIYFFLSFEFPCERCLHLPLYTPTAYSIVCLSCIWRNDSGLASGVWSSSASFIETHETHVNTRHRLTLVCMQHFI